ncbi:phage tail protein [Plantactinospora sp. WMMB334]|uniref:phage tail protein n=1 Tax=Plantactinospora sp. WMMB334 TaxID=3404119 RepID=UPI003B9434F4
MSRYLDHLPAMFRGDPFAGRFLLAFEAVLTGRDDVDGLEQLIERSARYLDPMETDEDFLPWLAGWVALSLRADWDVARKKGFIREVVPLYRQRGTLAGLRRMLEIYLNPLADQVTREDVVILDRFDAPDHYFQVQLTLGDSDPVGLRRVQEVARAIIDREKPAHTFYALKVVVPTMRIVSEELKEREGGRPERLVLGVNTLLGTRDSN